VFGLNKQKIYCEEGGSDGICSMRRIAAEVGATGRSPLHSFGQGIASLPAAARPRAKASARGAMTTAFHESAVRPKICAKNYTVNVYRMKRGDFNLQQLFEIQQNHSINPPKISFKSTR